MTSLHNQKKTRVARGFTLVELMVALTGGLFFTIFVFMMSKDAAQFFQGQARSSEATLAAITGYERLRADIARAGFLASPNVRYDVNRCPRPTPGGGTAAQQTGSDFIPGLQEMALAHITSGNLGTGNPMLDLNAGGLDPDQIILWGNYSSSEQFPVRSVDTGNNQILLELGSSALLREGVAAAADLPTLQNIFKVGSILRIVDETGREQYTIIAAVTFNAAGIPAITYGTVALVLKSANPRCGLRALGAGISVNPVDMIRYRLASLAGNTAFSPILSMGQAGDSDNTRLELIRESLNPAATSTTVDPAFILSTELVAEYAVDLKFGLTVQPPSTTGTLTYLGEDDANLPTYAGNVATTTASPHLIRGIHARLAVRNRDPDREAPVLTGTALTNATSEDLIRIQVSANPAQYARMRSLRSHIATRNTRNEMWN